MEPLSDGTVWHIVVNMIDTVVEESNLSRGEAEKIYNKYAEDLDLVEITLRRMKFNGKTNKYE